MNKYGALTEYLRQATARGRASVELSFRDLDRIVGGLPPSARAHRPWWGNSESPQARAWRSAGFAVDSVSLDHERVRFAKAAAAERRTRLDRAPVAEPGETSAVTSGPGLAVAGAPVTVSVSVQWLMAGHVQLDDGGKPAFPTLPRAPGLYRFRFSGGPLDRARIYIGESDDLRRRGGNYRNPGPTQPTNIRVNALLREHLAQGGEVEVLVATSAEVNTAQGAARLDLSRKAARLLAENACLVAAQISDDADIENLG